MKDSSVVHPFLIGLFPILAIYTRNLHELEPGVILLPSGVVLGLTGLCFWGLSRTSWGAQRAGLLVTWSLMLFFAFGHVATGVDRWTGLSLNYGDPGMSLVVAYAACTGLWILGFVFLREPTRPLTGVTKFLNVFGVCLIGLVGAQFIYALLQDPPRPAVQGLGKEYSGDYLSPSAAAPDIYFIVLDGYARGDVLEDIYGFDNRPFLDDLAGLGFRINEKSRANYSQTSLSLASALNMTYAENLLERIPLNSFDRRPLGKLIKESKVATLLKERGYRTAAFATGYALTEITAADRFVKGSANVNEFETVLLSTTPLPFLMDSLLRPGVLYERHRRRVLDAFEMLPEVATDESPKFVFAHIMSPHPPFVFGAQGEFLNQVRPYSVFDGSHFMRQPRASREEYRSGYVRQIQFVNQGILATLRDILKNSQKPPIIILLGDHGPGMRLDWQDPDRTDMRERLAILSAHFFPGSEASVLPPVSPVNTFRLVFRHYFGASFEMLPDESYYSTWERPYRFLKVTCKVDPCAAADGRPTGTSRDIPGVN